MAAQHSFCQNSTTLFLSLLGIVLEPPHSNDQVSLINQIHMECPPDPDCHRIFLFLSIQAFTSFAYSKEPNFRQKHASRPYYRGCARLLSTQKRGIDNMAKIATSNYANAKPNIPHRTLPSLERPQHNIENPDSFGNRLSIISDQLLDSPIPPRLPRSHNLFMQNKPNFLQARIYLTSYPSMGYGTIRLPEHRINKPNLGSEFIPAHREHAGNQTHRPRTAQASINMQNKPNLLEGQINVNAVAIMDYRDSRLGASLENKPNFQQTTFCR